MLTDINAGSVIICVPDGWIMCPLINLHNFHQIALKPGINGFWENPLDKAARAHALWRDNYFTGLSMVFSIIMYICDVLQINATPHKKIFAFNLQVREVLYDLHIVVNIRWLHIVVIINVTTYSSQYKCDYISTYSSQYHVTT